MKTLFALIFTLAPSFAQASMFDDSVANLPDHIKPTAGEVSLVADFNTQNEDGSISVYLINDSEVDITLNAQDGDVYLKLEYQAADGKWVRAQSHAYSWCGNSYMFGVELRKSHFVLIKGYQPNEGDNHSIRFSLYGQVLKLSSNVGAGIAAPSDIALAAGDTLAIRSGGFEMVANIAQGKTKPQTIDHINPQNAAIRQLGSGRFDYQKSRAILKSVADELPAYREMALLAVQSLDEKESQKEEDAPIKDNAE